MVSEKHLIRQLTLSLREGFSERKEDRRRNMTLTSGGGPISSPRIVKKEGETIVVVPHTINLNFQDTSSKEDVLNLILMADIKLTFSSGKEESIIAQIEKTNELSPELEKRAIERLMTVGLAILVRLSQDLGIRPPIFGIEELIS